MLANLESSRGLVFSQAVLLQLTQAGLTRDEAYRVVQGHAMKVWDGEGTLRSSLEADANVTLSTAQLDEAFSTDWFLRNSGIVWERLEALTLSDP